MLISYRIVFSVALDISVSFDKHIQEMSPGFGDTFCNLHNKLLGFWQEEGLLGFYVAFMCSIVFKILCSKFLH